MSRLPTDRRGRPPDASNAIYTFGSGCRRGLLDTKRVQRTESSIKKNSFALLRQEDWRGNAGATYTRIVGGDKNTKYGAAAGDEALSAAVVGGDAVGAAAAVGSIAKPPRRLPVRAHLSVGQKLGRAAVGRTIASSLARQSLEMVSSLSVCFVTYLTRSCLSDTAGVNDRDREISSFALSLAVHTRHTRKRWPI